MEIGWRRAGAYVLCRDDCERVLLTRYAAPGHPDDGKWTVPGGGMEWGESPQETAVRELYEETGLVVTLGPVLDVFSRWFTATETIGGAAGHLIGPVYEATSWEGELRDEFADVDTTDAAGWFTLDEARVLPRVELLDFVLERL
jgi:8-oxo-dGTP diphosphatase